MRVGELRVGEMSLNRRKRGEKGINYLYATENLNTS